jgi:uncharacterized protein YacL (UPF0231 family)
MKLYTEEQMAKVWMAGQKYWETSGASITFEELLEQEKPIELPSDEEIEEDMKGQSGEYACGWEDAFNWMKEQILNQNK